MAIITGTPEQIQQMRRVRTEVERTIGQFRENTEVAVIVFALTQIARTLLRKYPQETEAELLAALVAFYRNVEVEPDESRIIIPSRLH